MIVDSTALDRTRRLLNHARYVNLATASPQGQPWVATLEYVWFAAPLRLVFGSATSSRHGLDIAANPAVSGALFLPPSTAGLDIDATDGAQFTGVCSEIPATELDDYYSDFYRGLFRDPAQRAQFQLERSLLAAPAPHRLYLVAVRRWWLIDTRTWERDRIDRRMRVPPAELEQLGTVDAR